MKKLLFLFLLFAGLPGLAQESAEIIITKEKIQPAIKAVVQSKPVTVLKESITFQKKGGNILIVQTDEKNLLQDITMAKLINPAVVNLESEGTIDIAKGTMAFHCDELSAAENIHLQITFKNKKPVVIAHFKVDERQVEAGGRAATGKKALNYSALARKMNLKLDLADQYPNPGTCCTDDLNPCDNGTGKERYNKNKIIYNAQTNELTYYKMKGRGSNKTTLKQEIDFEDITIRAGSPLSFEVRNINPDAFKVEITDTAIAYVIQTDSLLNLLPGTGGFETESFVNEEPVSEADSSRAKLLFAYINLKEFFLHLQNGCIYEFNKNITRKTEVKKRVDDYIHKQFNTNGAAGFAQTISLALDTANGTAFDKELYVNLLGLYNKLPASYYRMIAQIPQVPKDKDKIVFTFNILARENTPYMSLVNKKSVEAYIVKNLRIDFSTGLYYAFNMNTGKYLTRADSIVGRNTANTTDSTFRTGNRIIHEGVDKGEFGIASFIHFYRRTTPSFSWGGHIGAGLNINDKVKPRFFGGLSFMLGRDNTRFVINTGVVGGNIEKLSDQYANTSWLLPADEKTLVTRIKFVAQPFVSISYNLPFRSKKKAAAEVKPAEQEKKEKEADPEEVPSEEKTKKKSN